MKIRIATECSITDIQTIAANYWSSTHNLAAWERGQLHRDGAVSLRPWITTELVSQRQKHIPGKRADLCSASLPPNGGRKWHVDFRALSSCMRWQRWRWKVVKSDVCPVRTSYLRFVDSGPEGGFQCRSVPWLYLLSKEITRRDIGGRWCRSPVWRNEDLSQGFTGGRAGQLRSCLLKFSPRD